MTLQRDSAMHCIISDLSTVVVLWPFSICNCLPPLFRAGFAQPLSELIFCHIYHTDCAMFNLFHTHQHIFHIWSYIFFDILWCTNTKRWLSNLKCLHSIFAQLLSRHPTSRTLTSQVPHLSLIFASEIIFFFLDNLRPNYPYKKPWLTLGTRFSGSCFEILALPKGGKISPMTRFFFGG